MSGEVDDVVRENGVAASKLLQALTALAQMHQAVIEQRIRAADRVEQALDRKLRRAEQRERILERKQQRQEAARRADRDTQRQTDAIRSPELERQLREAERTATEARLAAYDAARRLDADSVVEWADNLRDAGIDPDPIERMIASSQSGCSDVVEARLIDQTDAVPTESERSLEPDGEPPGPFNDVEGAGHLDSESAPVTVTDLVLAAHLEQEVPTSDSLAGAHFDPPADTADHSDPGHDVGSAYSVGLGDE